ncbi:MAG: 50S ribosomal protein L29 [Candidatus Puniceispirillum sp. TMED52]|nr:50S ribosomal protein L29 [SAR116 cluster bacterium]OUU49865.1 MAG: 50S ribosomal protein L29 [Candidatus Puniceispirillum sp. TMED52]|tara:strand:+ start:5938 stop:6153 length:216 start_codon:yes stop_codon:yes gene_type:complete
MAAVKAEELRSKSPDELKTQLTSLKKEAFNLRFQGATGQLENPARMRLVRREIARVKTVLAEKSNATSVQE